MFVYRIHGVHRERGFTKIGVTDNWSRRKAEHTRALGSGFGFRSIPLAARQARALERMWTAFLAFHEPQQLPTHIVGYTESWLSYLPIEPWEAEAFWNDSLLPLAEPASLDYTASWRIPTEIRREAYKMDRSPDTKGLPYEARVELAEERWVANASHDEHYRYLKVRDSDRFRSTLTSEAS